MNTDLIPARLPDYHMVWHEVSQAVLMDSIRGNPDSGHNESEKISSHYIFMLRSKDWSPLG